MPVNEHWISASCWLMGRIPWDSNAQRSMVEASIITFDSAATSYIASHKRGWKNEKHEQQQWKNTLATYASPAFGSLPVGQIETALVIRVLEPIWASKTETASRERGSVLRWHGVGWRIPAALKRLSVRR